MTAADELAYYQTLGINGLDIDSARAAYFAAQVTGGAGAVSATYVARSHVPANAKDWGAVGDGTSRPLSTQFGTLAAAQAVYPAATALTDELDWAAIQSSINATGGCFLPKPSGNGYVINNTLDLTGVSGDAWLSGPVGNRSVVYMTANNLPIVKASTAVRLEELWLTYSRQQTSAETNSNGIQLLNIGNPSLINRVTVNYAARGIYSDPTGFTYSTTFSNIAIGYYSITAFNVGNTGGITGNVISNLYTQNNAGGTIATSTEVPVQLAGWDDGVINQLNVEHTKASAALIVNNCYNLTVNSLHVEGLVMNGDYGGVVSLTGTTDLNLSGYSVVFSTFDIANIPSGTTSLLKVVGGVRASVSAINERGNTITGAVTTRPFVFLDSSVTDANPAFVDINEHRLNAFYPGSTGSTTRLPTLRVSNGDRSWSSLGAQVMIPGTAIPTGGAWSVGDRIVNTTPTVITAGAAQYTVRGWVCTVAGTPGTWQEERHYLTVSPVGKGARCYLNGTVSIAAFTTTAVALTSTDYNDDAAYYSLTSGGIGLAKAGLYQVTFAADCAAGSAGGSLDAYVMLDSATVAEVSAYTDSREIRLAGSTIVRATAGQVLTLGAYFSTATNIVGSIAKDTNIAVAYLGA